MTQAIIFDMDGLLIDSEPIWRAVQIECFASVGVTLNDELCRETMGQRLDAAVQHWFSRFPWDAKSPQQLGIEIITAMEKAIKERAVLLPGVLEAISYARQKRFKTAVASSSPLSLINAMVERFSLHKSFDILHSAEHESAGKPDPAVYNATARLLGVATTECIAIEDSVAGVTSAKQAGMLCCAVPDRHADLRQFMHADVVIDSLVSLPRSLERIA